MPIASGRRTVLDTRLDEGIADMGSWETLTRNKTNCLDTGRWAHSENLHRDMDPWRLMAKQSPANPRRGPEASFATKSRYPVVRGRCAGSPIFCLSFAL